MNNFYLTSIEFGRETFLTICYDFKDTLNTNLSDYTKIHIHQTEFDGPIEWMPQIYDEIVYSVMELQFEHYQLNIEFPIWQRKDKEILTNMLDHHVIDFNRNYNQLIKEFNEL